MDENRLIVHLTDICFTYPHRGVVLDKLNFSFHRGDKIGLMGANGSGKTTLLHLIVGLLKPASGRIEILGRPVRGEKDFVQVRKNIGLLFQDADDQLFSPTVLEDVAFGPLNLGKGRDEAKRIARETLASLGLEGFEDRVTHKLSGGEKRLVSLATVLAMKPEALLLDEPTTGLDNSTEKRLIDILKELDCSYLVISHDLDFLAQTTNQIGHLSDGKLTIDEEVTPHVHVHTHKHGRYTHEHTRK
jgi:cobalt/nickel transport system ATP-binding protein